MKKKIFFKHVATFLLLATLLVTHSCKEDFEDLQDLESQDSSSKSYKTINYQDIQDPAIYRAIDQALEKIKNNLPYQKVFNHHPQLKEITINKDYICLFTDENNLATYSLTLQLAPQDKQEAILYNLLLQYNKNQEIEAHLIKHQVGTDIKKYPLMGVQLKINQAYVNYTRGWVSYGSASGGGATDTGTGGASGAPYDVILQYAYQTRNYALASYLGVILSTRPVAFYDQGILYRWVYPELNLSTTYSQLLIPSSHTTNNSFVSFAEFNDYYYFKGLKKHLYNYYTQCYVTQTGGFVFSDKTTEKDHLRKQTFVNSFFDFMFEMQRSNMPGFYSVIGDEVAMANLFNFFAEHNKRSDAKAFIGSPYLYYNDKAEDKFYYWAANYLKTDPSPAKLANLADMTKVLEAIMKQTPCDRMNNVLKIKDFTSKIEDLKGKLSVGYETAYTLNNYGVYNFYQGEPFDIEKPSKWRVSMPHNENNAGFIHTHALPKIPQGKRLGFFADVFSPQDIQSFMYNAYLRNNNNLSTTNFFIMVMSPDGSLYALLVEDINAVVNANKNGLFRDANSKWYDYKNHKKFFYESTKDGDEQTGIFPNNNRKNQEKDVLLKIKEHNLGLGFYKYNGTSFDRLGLDSNNNVINNPCK